MRFENLFQSSYWLLPPTPPNDARLTLALLLAGVLWIVSLARRSSTSARIMQTLVLVPGLIIAASGVGRLLSIDLLQLRLWWALAAIVAVLPICTRILFSPRTKMMLPVVSAGCALILLILTITWNIATIGAVRTRGVTASDPYAYAQMGVDLANTGSVAHNFPLVKYTYKLGIDTAPVVHVGYLLPKDERRQSTTVWPPGYAAFTALAFMVGGEPGLYLVTPILALVAIILITWLGYVVMRFAGGSKVAALWCGVLGATFSATGYQQVEWQMIPMADIASQVFSIMSLLLALTSARGRGAVSTLAAVTSGMALGIAFDVRYTQILVAPALAWALWGFGPAKTALRRTSLCAIAALVVALPVLIFNAMTFGSPFAIGSEEGGNFSVSAMPQTVVRIVGQLSLENEFGLLWGAVAVGAVLLCYSDWRTFGTLAIYVFGVFALHAFYSYLRPRDLLSLFPVLYVLCAFALFRALNFVFVTGRKLEGRLGQSGSIAVQIGLCLIVALAVTRTAQTFWQRTEKVVQLPQTRGFNTFGYLYQPQRDAFQRLQELTEPQSAIATTLNGGAIDFYANRLSFRLADWNHADGQEFLSELLDAQIPIYALYDGVEIEQALNQIDRSFLVTKVADVAVPYYDFRGGGSQPRTVALARITQNR